MVNETTGYSPYQMVYGKVGRGPLKVMRYTWGRQDLNQLSLNKTSVEYLENHKKELEHCKELAAISCERTQSTYTEQYNVCSRPKTFEVSESVLVLLPDSTNKLKSSPQGPGIIQFKLSENS